MISRSVFRQKFGSATKQQGVVLFFALIALVVMSLAAVALIRSVDTSTMIAGNLALRQSATTSGDAGVEAAMNWLSVTQAASTKDVKIDTTHPFNTTVAYIAGDLANPVWYHSSIRPNITDLTDGTVDWDETDSKPAITDAAGNAMPDASGNTVRYIIERMCRYPNSVPSKTNCLVAIKKSATDTERQIVGSDGACTTCTTFIESTQFRVTSKIVGPKNTVSYIQSFVY